MMTRRALLQAGVAVAAASRQPAFAYVGSYTTEKRHARGDGIHVYRTDPQTGIWTHTQHVGNLVNPSFLIASPDRRFLYSVHGDERYATAFSIERDTGALTILGKADTGGANGVCLALSRNGRFLVVANYASGTVAVLPVTQDGKLADQIQLVELPGKPGTHRVEQASSHPHQIVFDPSGGFVLVPDKGLDRVFVFRFDQELGKLTPTEQGSFIARAGSGPRHLAFHPSLPIVWILNELNSTVTTCRWDAARGALHAVRILPSLPPDFTGESTAAEIAVSSNGRFVYCSNRGHDSIAIFGVDRSTGFLNSIGWAPSLGKSPRFIALDPSQRFLYSTNEQGDNIAAFRVDPATGRLTPNGEPVRMASPVTIAFA